MAFSHIARLKASIMRGAILALLAVGATWIGIAVVSADGSCHTSSGHRVYSGDCYGPNDRSTETSTQSEAPSRSSRGLFRGYDLAGNNPTLGDLVGSTGLAGLGSGVPRGLITGVAAGAASGGASVLASLCMYYCDDLLTHGTRSVAVPSLHGSGCRWVSTRYGGMQHHCE